MFCCTRSKSISIVDDERNARNKMSSGNQRAEESLQYKHWSTQYINKARQCSDYDSQSQMPQKWIALGPNTYFLTQFRKTDVL